MIAKRQVCGWCGQVRDAQPLLLSRQVYHLLRGVKYPVQRDSELFHSLCIPKAMDHYQHQIQVKKVKA